MQGGAIILQKIWKVVVCIDRGITFSVISDVWFPKNWPYQLTYK